MKKFMITFMMLFFLTNWNTEEIVLESTWQVLHILDWGTTLNIVDRQNEGYYELNPILGEHPSRSKVNLYMFAGAVLHPIIVHYLPRDLEILGINLKPKRSFQGISIGMSGGCVINNFSIGLKWEF